MDTGAEEVDKKGFGPPHSHTSGEQERLSSTGKWGGGEEVMGERRQDPDWKETSRPA